MKIELQEVEPIDYNFDYKKDTVYKTKSLLNTKSNGKFSLKMSTDEDLELIFKSKFYNNNILNNPLIFSPVRLKYNLESNLFFIKNKEHLRQQWDKHKEKFRNKSNLATILIFERLYFYIPLGLEYDLLSNGCYLPFFLNIYHQEIKPESVYKGMDWVHTPLNLPLKINYQFNDQKENIISFKGQVILDEEKLAQIILDKNFQKHMKPYHYTKDFTIESDVQIAYNMENGYIISSIFWLKIFSKSEEINEEIEFKVVQDGKDNLLTFGNAKLHDNNISFDSVMTIEEKEEQRKNTMLIIVLFLFALSLIFGALYYKLSNTN